MKTFRVLLIVALTFAVLGFQVGSVNASSFVYTSGIQVQNLENAPSLVTLVYYNAMGSGGTGGGESTSVSIDMPALSSSTFFPIHAGAGFNGSVVISSDRHVAAVANLVGSIGSTHMGDASYVGMSAGSTPLNLPLLHKNNYGFNSFFSVQNSHATNNASVNVSYSDGTTVGPIVIKPGASYTFDQALESHSLKSFAATVTSTQPIVAVVVQENSTGNTVQAYTGFDVGEVNALMPLVNVNNYGYYTGIQLQNVGNQASDITVTYTPISDALGPIGTQCTEKHQVAAGASTTYALAAFTMGTFPTGPNDVTTCSRGERFVGSAQITGNSTSQPVNVVVNQATPRAAGAYGGFAPSRATAKIILPLIMDRNYGWYTGFNLMNVGTGPVDVSCVFTADDYVFTQTLDPGEATTDIQQGKIKDKYAGSGVCTATGTNPKITAVVNQISPNANDNLLVYEGINVLP